MRGLQRDRGLKNGAPDWRGHLQKIASNGRSQTSSEEDGLIVESIAYYGTYTVSEEVNVISLHLDASTFPNQVGTDQKRTITSHTANELKYSSPAAISGVQVHQVWKRAE
jgi:Lipocalin-like domain